MKTILLAAIAAVTIAMSGATSGQELNRGQSKQALKDRIGLGNNLFQETIKNNPGAILTVTFSFNSHKKIKDVIEAAEKYNLKLTGFRHREGVHNGGFSFVENANPFDEAEKYRVFMLEMAESVIELIDTQIEQKKNNSPEAIPEDMKSLRARKNEMKKMRNLFKKEGVRIVGADFTGTGIGLKVFAENNKNLARAAEIVEDGKRNAAIEILK